MSTYTIEPEQEPDGSTGWWVWEHCVYERSSVLAGQTRRARVDCFDSLDKARAEFPRAQVLDGAFSHGANRQAISAFMRCPAPDDFDPADAGEEW